MVESVQQPAAVDLESLLNRIGDDVFTVTFRALVADIVGIVHPDIQEVRSPDHGWGTSTFVGTLTAAPHLRAWRAESSISKFGVPDEREVEGLFMEAVQAAESLDLQLKSWTLCLPVELEVAALKRWNSWAKRMRKSTGVVIQLWSAGTIRRRLLSAEGAAVREYYFPEVRDEESPSPLRPLHDLSDPDTYQDALFVRQLDEAGLIETYAAREAFFNAEILSREVADKGDRSEIEQLRAWRMRVHFAWDRAFNLACQRSPERAPVGLYSDVMATIEAGHANEAEALRASVLHGAGLMHQAVDNSRAGWVRDWREVARLHTSQQDAGRSDVEGDPDE